jgi:hypothetical protein
LAVAHLGEWKLEAFDGESSCLTLFYDFVFVWVKMSIKSFNLNLVATSRVNWREIKKMKNLFVKYVKILIFTPFKILLNKKFKNIFKLWK